MIVRHIVTGANVDPAAVARAVELSDSKYCTVVASLRSAPVITSEYRIEA
jgi:putative redox protein